MNPKSKKSPPKRDDIVSRTSALLRENKTLHALWDKATGKVRILQNFLEWAENFEHQDRVVERHLLSEGAIEVEVLTTFLGIDRGDGSGGPKWFETTVIVKDDPTGDADEYVDQPEVRYGTHQEALKGHAKVVKQVRKRLDEFVTSLTTKATSGPVAAPEVTSEGTACKAQSDEVIPSSAELTSFQEALRKL